MKLPAGSRPREAVSGQRIVYEKTTVDRSGNLTVFTNALTERGELLPEGKRVPVERRGDAFLVIREYGTPLGVETEINHVGDCFD